MGLLLSTLNEEGQHAGKEVRQAVSRWASIALARPRRIEQQGTVQMISDGTDFD